MQHLITLVGKGRLITRQAGSARATYRLSISRLTSGSECGNTVTAAELESEPWAVVVARIDGAAVLMLEGGEVIEIRLTGHTADEVASFIVTGRLLTF
jgi:hypothetical protein